jgi:type II secretory pathway pseudopilin PulG
LKEAKVGSGVRQFGRRAAFTIVELLTVMSVIIILMGLLVPALNAFKKVAKKVAQRNQFHTIGVSLEMFNAEWEQYPPSDGWDEMVPDRWGWDYTDGAPLEQGGAQILAEAMVGQDLVGFHPDADFTWGNPVYSNPDLSGRRSYLKLENANAYRLGGLYSGERLGTFHANQYVLCDVYRNNWTYNNQSDPADPINGQPVGMPILYYRVNMSGTTHPTYTVDLETGELVPLNGVPVDAATNLYDYRDNQGLVCLGMPWVRGWAGAETHHRMLNPEWFYYKTWNQKIDISEGRPYNTDSYILISAGIDGKYGTNKDVYNFGL